MKIRDVVAKAQDLYDRLLDWAEDNPLNAVAVGGLVVGSVVGFLAAKWVF